MGYAKERWMEQMERGYSPPDDTYVCAQCVTDEHLKASLDAECQADRACSFCGSNEAADIDVLLDEIGDAILADYTDPANELPYETREGGYQGVVYDGHELVQELTPWTDNDDLLEAVSAAFAGSAWCQRHYFSLTRYDALEYGWRRFSEQVKHRTRFLFLQELGDPNDWSRGDEIPPGRMLDELGEIFRRFHLIAERPVDTDYFRARVVVSGARPATAAQLGTAPRDAAIYPNRMSPAGIPMFYAAFDEDTAVVETFEPSRAGSREIAVARFRSVRPLTFVDLTSLPEIPSDFDRENKADQQPLRFLWSFARELARPVARDERAHTEYAPTQVVTEFIRHRFRPVEDRPAVDGVMYASSKERGSVAVVVFADPEQCGPRDDLKPYDDAPFLNLVDVRHATPGDFEHLWQAS